jgi:DNA helicase-2/ATP-dependent DNA helicase PcrA
VGSLVRHPRFGGGTILDREGRGKHLKLTIQFSDHGRKKILPAYTKLMVEAR